tara:strand:+ start:1134 stop:1841 length:708 start_codon:yes stop_codon:yes gene_type:complete
MVRAKSLVTGRVMHMVSEIEGAYLHLIDFTPGVVDIREQSLCDFEMTVDIARRLRVRHPRAWEGHLVPMTTDFLVTFDDAWGRRELALSVKSEGELRGRKKARVFQKLAIEQLYHVAKGRSFLLVTDAGINPRVMSNLALLGEAFRSGSSEISDAEQSAFERAFPRHEKDGSTIRERIDVAALASGLPSQKAIDAFRRAVWSRRILIDLRQWIRLNSEFVPTTDVNLGVELPWSR